MIIFNYNRIIKNYTLEIEKYSKRIDYNNYKDSFQDISIYVYENLFRFDPTKASFNYYVKILITTSYRKIIFDKKKQQKFEESFYQISDNVFQIKQEDNYLDLVEQVVNKLSSKKEIIVFYTLLYAKDYDSYVKLAELLNMKYVSFFKCLRSIRKTVCEVVKETHNTEK